MENKIPRIVIAGTNSGCGKTTVTCAVLQALVDRKLSVGAFKCGPDYIDPMFHSRVTGNRCANLDSFFFPENTLKYLLAKNAAGRDVSIIEGVMGLYDGLGLTSTTASTYEVAKITESPVILVVSAKGGALSILATIHGFLDFMPDSQIRGVILNGCSGAAYSALSKEIVKRFAPAVTPLGYLPMMPECSLESRYLGLITAEEVTDLQEKVRLLAAQAEKSIDIDGLLNMAQGAPKICYEKPLLMRQCEQAVIAEQCEPVVIARQCESAVIAGQCESAVIAGQCESAVIAGHHEPVRIAVARDRAFCFYYEDNLDLLREMGAEIVPFSPLSDSSLPGNIDGLYLGGGYPELYAEQLSGNLGMRHSIKKALEQGLPCIAECGGFMYLTEKIGEMPGVGVLAGKCYDTGRLSRFGYVTLTAGADNMLCKKGESIRAHEFHHWDCEEPGNAFTAAKAGGRSWACVHAGPALYAGFPHFHFYANPAFAENFYRACVNRKLAKTLPV